MSENMSRAGGLPMAEAFVIALGKTDLGRQEAHELVRQISMDAESNKLTFNEAISNNSTVKEYLSNEVIQKTLEPENYIGHSEEIIDKVLDSL
jgi:adenylosuccinate lyase